MLGKGFLAQRSELWGGHVRGRSGEKLEPGQKERVCVFSARGRWFHVRLPLCHGTGVTSIERDDRLCKSMETMTASFNKDVNKIL